MIDYAQRFKTPEECAVRMGSAKQIIWGVLAGVLAAPAAWLVLCVFLQLDVLFK